MKHPPPAWDDEAWDALIDERETRLADRADDFDGSEGDAAADRAERMADRAADQ